MGPSGSTEITGQFWALRSGVQFILTLFGKSRLSQQEEMRISLRWNWGTLSTTMVSDWFLLLHKAKEEISEEDWVPVIQVAERGLHVRCCGGHWVAWEAVGQSIHQTSSLCWEINTWNSLKGFVYVSPCASGNHSSSPAKLSPCKTWLPSSCLHLNGICCKFPLFFFPWMAQHRNCRVAESVSLVPVTHLLPLTKAFLSAVLS